MIQIRGARTHNLKNIDLDLPRERLIVVTGLSGSGKSSLAFDTIYAEGQRRYVESLSAYARQFLSVMEKPDVDHIEGLSPAISIEQKSTSHNPRSTVGTITEIYDYLRLLFARAGEPRCPDHDTLLQAQTVSQMVDTVMAMPEGGRWMLLAPIVSGRKGEHQQVFESLRAQGFIRVRVNGVLYELDEVPDLDRYRNHSIDVVVDRFRIRPDLALRLAESFETALSLADGRTLVVSMDDDAAAEVVFSAKFACHVCGYSLPELEPRLFSFNNPAGACPTCDGLGARQFFDPRRVVTGATLTLPAGAIRGWDRRNAYYFQMLQALSAHYEFDLDTPFNEIEDRVRNVILYGSGAEKIAFTYHYERRGGVVREHVFEGVVPNMERRYRETESNVVREELAKFLSSQPCPDCKGTRLNVHARHVFIGSARVSDITAMGVGASKRFLDELELPGARGQVAEKIVKEISARLSFLMDVGLDYLTLDRSAETLSGGEAQRIRLASQIGAGLVGVMYILDEPSIGLHQRDNRRLLDSLLRLRDIGNTVIVVEHDEEAIREADYVVDMGPGAGVHGGQVVAVGTPDAIAREPASLTGQYLSGHRSIAVPSERTAFDPERWLRMTNARGNNLRGVDLEIPLGLMTCVTGVSGSGKSTLVNDTLYRAVAQRLNDASTEPAPFDELLGLGRIDKVVDIDQSPIGRTPRSNPATYTGLFTTIRELFAGTPEARSRGYTPGRFSFNVRGGRCEACKGDGLIKVEMHFLPDVYVPCDVCKAKRYNRETLDIRYRGKTIHEVLDLTIEDARDFFEAIPLLARRLETLLDVGLGYVRLGQSATTLSGGEAQRVKLSRELSKRDTGRTLYILDEPTTGLHFFDIEQLLRVLHRLRDRGNTIVVIEHNLDVIKTADWVIDLGEEGGDGREIAGVRCPDVDDYNRAYDYTERYKQMRHDLDAFYQEVYVKGRINMEMRFLEKCAILAEIEKEIDAIRDKTPQMSADAIRDKYNVHEIVCCPDIDAAQAMVDACNQISATGDSAGGLVEVVVTGAPAGLGEPVFSKLDAELGRMLGIGAIKGVEIGAGFGVKDMTGYENNDQMHSEDGKVVFDSNNAGGITGGVSTGQTIVARLAVKPTPTIDKPQHTIDKYTLENKDLAAITRRDPTIVARIWPVAENYTAMVILDHLMMHRGYQSFIAR